MLMDYSVQTLDYNASMNGMDGDNCATMSGYSNAEEYNKAMKSLHENVDVLEKNCGRCNRRKAGNTVIKLERITDPTGLPALNTEGGGRSGS